MENWQKLFFNYHQIHSLSVFFNKFFVCRNFSNFHVTHKYRSEPAIIENLGPIKATTDGAAQFDAENTQ